MVARVGEGEEEVSGEGVFACGGVGCGGVVGVWWGWGKEVLGEDVFEG